MDSVQQTEITADQQAMVDRLSVAIREAVAGPTSKDATLLVTASLKIADLQEQVKHVKRQYDILEHCYRSETLRADRAARLLKEYALLPDEHKRVKLDRKLGLFFPAIREYVSSRRR